jgi:hypothetical protein
MKGKRDEEIVTVFHGCSSVSAVTVHGTNLIVI